MGELKEMMGMGLTPMRLELFVDDPILKGLLNGLWNGGYPRTLKSICEKAKKPLPKQGKEDGKDKGRQKESKL